MKNPGKAIKIVSIILLIWGILCGVGGVALTAGGSLGTYYTTTNSETIDNAVNEDTELSSNLDELNSAVGSDVSASEAVTYASAAALVIGICLILSAIFDIISAIFGFRAAKGKSAKPAFVIGVITVIFAVISIINSISDGGLSAYVIISGILNLILPIIYTYAANQIKKENA